MNNLLLIEDDESLGTTLTERLQKEGYSVQWAEDIQSGRKLIEKAAFDLVILDVRLPDGSGFDFAQEVKKKYSVPLIFVSAMTTAPDRLRGYEIGAEEYIPKPFHLRELLLRVRHVLLNHAAQKKLACGDQVIDLHSRTVVSKSGKSDFLPSKDFETLKLLIDVSPRVVSRDEILNSIWGEERFPSPRTVDNVILRLRNVLHDDKNTYIRSVRGVGYQWLGEK